MNIPVPALLHNPVYRLMLIAARDFIKVCEQHWTLVSRRDKYEKRSIGMRSASDDQVSLEVALQ